MLDHFSVSLGELLHFKKIQTVYERGTLLITDMLVTLSATDMHGVAPARVHRGESHKVLHGEASIP
jgi:hypothetical protein